MHESERDDKEQFQPYEQASSWFRERNASDARCARGQRRLAALGSELATSASYPS